MIVVYHLPAKAGDTCPEAVACPRVWRRREELHNFLFMAIGSLDVL